MILAIDPGDVLSAYVVWDGEKEVILEKGKIENKDLRQKLGEFSKDPNIEHCWIEMIQSYGMPVGQEVFETCVWIGRFMEIFEELRVTRIPRKKISFYHTKSMKAKDGNVRQALIDRYGKPGTQKAQGKLYKVSKDIWQALALAVYAMDLKHGRVYLGVSEGKSQFEQFVAKPEPAITE